MRDAIAVLDDAGHRDLSACMLPACAGPTGFAAPLSASALTALSAPRQRNLLRYWMRVNGIEMPDEKKMEELRALAGGKFRAGHARVAYHDGQMGRFHDGLFLLPRFTSLPAGEFSWTTQTALALPGSGTQLRVDAGKPGASTALCETLRGRKLTVRLRRGGELLRLPGHKHRHSLKNLLHDIGMPPWWRERAPLVYADGELAAVANVAVGAGFMSKHKVSGLQLIWERDTTLQS
jgi:tRNA(Ile)-lysidine synthase